MNDLPPDRHLPFDEAETAGDDGGENEIKNGDDDQRLVDQKRILPHLVGHGVEVHHGHSESKRRCFQLHHHLAGNGRQRDADGARQPDAANEGETAHAERPSRLQLAFRHRQQRAAQNLGFIGRVVQREADGGEEKPLAQHRPHETLAQARDHRQQRADAVIKQPELDQQRRAAKEGAITAGKKSRHPTAADLRKGKADGQHETDADGNDEQCQRLPGTGEKQRPIFGDP
ncbi:hypothetical protein AT6N2_C3265 [Agrobacterium tumefaciens]|nr:hypothetical protein AT6N2_C3265 [Agrobacterium tumefaciens]